MQTSDYEPWKPPPPHDKPQFIEAEGLRITLGAYVEAAPDHFMPGFIEAQSSGFDEPDLFFRAELRENIPRLVEIGWRAGANSREIRPADLRQADLSVVIDYWYAGATVRIDRSDRAVRFSADGNNWFIREIREHLAERRSGKRRITGDFLQRVAVVYRENIDHAPTAAVARTFGVKHRQATDYVKQARDRGLLPPTKQGRAKA